MDAIISAMQAAVMSINDVLEELREAEDELMENTEEHQTRS